MAKVNVEYDTLEKTMKCSIDGSDLEDVMEINMGRYGDEEALCSILMKKNIPEHKMVQYTRVMAKDTKGAKGPKVVQASHPDFVLVISTDPLPDEEVQTDIHQFLLGKPQK